MPRYAVDYPVRATQTYHVLADDHDDAIVMVWQGAGHPVGKFRIDSSQDFDLSEVDGCDTWEIS